MRELLELLDLCDRVGNHLVRRQLFVDDPVDERAVGAVFEQPAHQIRQQIAMITDRRVDPAVSVEFAAVQHLCIQVGAHAVQTLILEILPIPGKLVDRGDGMGVVRCKLRVERIAQLQQSPGAGQVGNVGIGLAREHRVVGVTLDLSEFDFGIPVSALDQPDRYSMAGIPGQRGEPVDRRPAAPQIGLQGNTEPVPAGELVVGQHRGEHVELQHQTRGLFGIDGQRDSGVARPDCQLGQDRHQFPHDASALRHFVARMQRRKLYGNTGRVKNVAVARCPADRVDGIRVRIAVATRIGGGERGLAQHVERVAIASIGLVARAFQGRFDGPAHHILMSHDPHRLPDRQTHNRFARLVGEPSQHRAHVAACRTSDPDHPPGEHQPPCRGIHEQRFAFAQVGLPVGL